MSWWVIPEGEAGQLIGQLIHDFESGSPSTVSGGIGSQLTVAQSTAKPSGAVAGPYATRAQAQAQADKLNQAITSATTPTAANVTRGLSGWAVQLGNTSGLLIRSLKVIIGGVLILSGIIHFAGGEKTVLQVAKGALVA